jgi:hypothetical protein
MPNEKIRIRVWVKESTSERLDDYVDDTEGAKVAEVVDAAIDAYLTSKGY